MNANSSSGLQPHLLPNNTEDMTSLTKQLQPFHQEVFITIRNVAFENSLEHMSIQTPCHIYSGWSTAITVWKAFIICCLWKDKRYSQRKLLDSWCVSSPDKDTLPLSFFFFFKCHFLILWASPISLHSLPLYWTGRRSFSSIIFKQIKSTT